MFTLPKFGHWYGAREKKRKRICWLSSFCQALDAQSTHTHTTSSLIWATFALCHLLEKRSQWEKTLAAARRWGVILSASCCLHRLLLKCFLNVEIKTTTTTAATTTTTSATACCSQSMKEDWWTIPIHPSIHPSILVQWSLIETTVQPTK